MTSLVENTDTSSNVILVSSNVGSGHSLGAVSGPDPSAFMFQLAGSTLTVFLKAGVVLDYETQTSYSATIALGGGQSFTINLDVLDQNDVAPEIITDATQSVAEGQTVIAALTSKDTDTVGVDPATFTISGGADQGLFDVVGGNLVFKSARDFETDAHSYTVEVSASDGVNATVKTITVNLGDVNDTAAVITTSDTQSVAEGHTLVAALTSTDADTIGTNPALFTIIGGSDQALFNISGGNLVFTSPHNFETEKHTYTVAVRADDGANITDRTITVTLTDVNEPPTAVALLNAKASLAENASTAAGVKVADIAVSDDALGSESLTLGGADAKYFEIKGAALYLKAGTKLDFETKASYAVAVSADDPTLGAGSDATSSTYTLKIANVSPEKIVGTAAANTLAGGKDKDLIFGLAGNDKLKGNDGSDVLTGGAGFDTLTGGAQADRFDFDLVADIGKAAGKRDVVTDFSTSGGDVIDLSTIDANAKTAKNDTFSFIKTAAFHHKAGELHYVKQDASGVANDKTIVEGDVNGDGKADFQIELTGLKTLTAGDFAL